MLILSTKPIQLITAFFVLLIYFFLDFMNNFHNLANVSVLLRDVSLMVASLTYTLALAKVLYSYSVGITSLILVLIK